jgi:hypothetical protein
MEAAPMSCASADQGDPNATVTNGLHSCQKAFLCEALQGNRKRLVIFLHNHAQRLQQHNHIVDLLKPGGQTISRSPDFASASICQVAHPL